MLHIGFNCGRLLVSSASRFVSFLTFLVGGGKLGSIRGFMGDLDDDDAVSSSFSLSMSFTSCSFVDDKGLIGMISFSLKVRICFGVALFSERL